MAVQLILLEQIHDNPYNPRSHYEPERTKEIASSIEQNGLIQVPKARKWSIDNYELAYGGYRLRAFKELAKRGPEKWGPAVAQYVVEDKLCMPLDIVEMSDVSMAVFALEENLKRQNMTPMDTANAIARYFEVFPTTKEEELAVKLSMAQATISNMRRVTKLPKEVLKYVDDETINFTQARELLLLQNVESITNGATAAKLVMIDCIELLGTPGYSRTVVGIKKAIHKVVHDNFRTLDPASLANPPIFDVKKCPDCDSVIKTTDESGKAAYHCLKSSCWDLQQASAKRKQEEDAKLAKAEAEEKRLAEEAEAKKKADAEAAERMQAQFKKQEEEAAQRKAAAEELAKKAVHPPEGVRLATEALAAGDCNGCGLTHYDHTIGFKFPDEKGTYPGICVKDYGRVTGEDIEPLNSEKKIIPQGISNHRVVKVDPERLGESGDIFKAFASGAIVSSEPVPGVFEFEGASWISAGDDPSSVGGKRGYRLVRREDWKDAIRTLAAPPEGVSREDWKKSLISDPLGAFNGTIAIWNGAEYVCAGPFVIFEPAFIENEAPAEIPPAAVKEGGVKEEPVHEPEKPVAEKAPEPAPVTDSKPAPATGEVETAPREEEKADEPELTDADYKNYRVTLTISVRIPKTTEGELNIRDAAIDAFKENFKEGNFGSDDYEIEEVDEDEEEKETEEAGTADEE